MVFAPLDGRCTLAFAQEDDTLTATGAFAVKYMLFTKAMGLASEVTLSLSTGEPVRVSYVVKGGGTGVVLFSAAGG